MSALGQAREDYLTARSNEDLADALLRISAISIDRAETLFAGVTFEHDHVRNRAVNALARILATVAILGPAGTRAANELVSCYRRIEFKPATGLDAAILHVRNNREGKDQ